MRTAYKTSASILLLICSILIMLSYSISYAASEKNVLIHILWEGEGGLDTSISAYNNADEAIEELSFINLLNVDTNGNNLGCINEIDPETSDGGHWIMATIGDAYKDTVSSIEIGIGDTDIPFTVVVIDADTNEIMHTQEYETQSNIYIKQSDTGWSMDLGNDNVIDLINDECSCSIGIQPISDIDVNIGSSTQYIIPINDLGIDYTLISDGCEEHTDEPAINIEEVSSSGGTVSISSESIKITGIDAELYSGIFRVTASVGDLSASTEFNINLEREVLAPDIDPESLVYDQNTGYLNFTVLANGNKEAVVHISDESDINIKFNNNNGNFEDYNVSVRVSDTKAPIASNVTISRDVSDQSKVRIEWEATDTPCIKEIYVEQLASESSGDSDSLKSPTYTIDIKSDTLYTTVSYHYRDSNDTAVSTVIGSKISDKYLVVELSSLLWDSGISIYVEDIDGNRSGSISQPIDNSIIYTSYTVNDSGHVPEGYYEYFDVKSNDYHDPCYNIPTIVRAEILYGDGQVDVVDASSLESAAGFEGVILKYTALSGILNNNIITIRYTYEKVREDIPALTGTLELEIDLRNMAPVAVDDGVGVTSGIAFYAGGIFHIPSSLLLQNDTDRESTPDELSIYSVATTSTSAYVSLVTLDGIQYVELNIHDKYFYGPLKFTYKAYDGELASAKEATVTVNVEKRSDPPVAKEVNVVMEVSASLKIVDANVDNKSNVPFAIEQITGVTINGSSDYNKNDLTISIEYSEGLDGELSPFIKVQKSGISIVDGDIISFPYTIVAEVSGETVRSSSTVTITVTSGDDPADREGFLYVHRRPLSNFGVSVIRDEESNTVIKDASISFENSFDLDHNKSHSASDDLVEEGGTRPNYSYMGIRAWEWSIKTISTNWETQIFDCEGLSGDTGSTGTGSIVRGNVDCTRQLGLNWINSKLKEYIEDHYQETIMVSLRVRDIDGKNNVGVWSEARTLTLTSMQMDPVAFFTLNKSTYIVPSEGLSTEEFTVQDLSYDPNGDEIVVWEWVLKDDKGAIIETSSNQDPSDAFRRAINNKVNGNWNPGKPEFTIELKVKDSTDAESDIYAVTFKVYKENEEPEFDNDSTIMDIEGSTVYQIDDGADGTVGDNWGQLGNLEKPGVPDFDSMFTITDDQGENNLIISWLFEGESVIDRKSWSEYLNIVTTYSRAGLKYKQSPFSDTDTVTSLGFKPGAYRITVGAKDNPSGTQYEPGSSVTTYWITNGDKIPYHMYVVPKLDLFTTIRFNGWILSGYYDAGGNWVDTSYRESDGATAAELGLSVEDIVPTIGDTIEIHVVTNKYTTSLYSYEDKNNDNRFNASDSKIAMKKGVTNLDGTIIWTGEYTLNDIEDADEDIGLTILNIRVHGDTTWGSETGNVTRSKEIQALVPVLPVKLYDFRITQVTDPGISDQILKYINDRVNSGEKLNNGSPTDGILVGHLALDDSNAMISGSEGLMSKGYSFYFKVSSKGLTSESDEIRIYPKFYAVETDSSGEFVIGKELVGCVPNKNGKYEIYTTSEASAEIDEMYGLYYEGTKQNSLGNHHEVIIGSELKTTNNSEQTWHGRYGIPVDARFFYSDSFSASNISGSQEWKGKVLVTFEIKAVKSGTSRYNYVERNQWSNERDKYLDTEKAVYEMKEIEWKSSGINYGSVIVFDSSSSIKDNYISNPVWRE